MRARITKFYTAGHRRLATGSVHQVEGQLSLARREGRYGRVPVLVLDGGGAPELLFEPRIVDMVSFNFVLGGLERAKDGAWVAQEWWLTSTPRVGLDKPEDWR